MKKVLSFVLIALSLNWVFWENIDMEVVRQTWVWWNNEIRQNLWLKPYFISENLNQTATNWSKISLQRWNITHKRNLSDAYYDYKKITNWFANQWVEFKNISRKTYSESIGRGKYSCKPDCTQGLIEWIKSTHKFFISEKWKSYAPHYNAMVMPEFEKIWVWIVVDEKNKKYYLTAHYWTEIIWEKNISSTKKLALENNEEKTNLPEFIEIQDKINLSENEQTEKLDLGKPILAETINWRNPTQIQQAKEKLSNLLKTRISSN